MNERTTNENSIIIVLLDLLQPLKLSLDSEEKFIN